MKTWIRVSRRTKCRVCGRPDWCTYTADGSACCMRVQSPKPMKNGGWLHKPNGSAIVPIYHKPEPVVVRDDLDAIASAAVERLGRSGRMELAASLGVSAASLAKLEVGRDDAGAYTFPMRNADDQIVGIRLRLRDGRKLSVKGGHEGCFVPRDSIGDQTEEVLVCEGPTDTAAGMDAGYAAIGRPSCRGGVDIACKLLKGRTAIIVSDNDGPGIAGAESLAQSLLRQRIACKIIRPMRGKDLRAWHPSRKSLAAVVGNADWCERKQFSP